MFSSKSASLVLLGLLLPVALAACAPREPGPIASPREQSRAKVRFDRALLAAALDTLASAHAASASGWSPAEGLRRDAIEATFEDLSFVVPEELLMVWGRHDGATHPAPYLGSHTLMSCGEARAAYDALRADPQVAWRHNWIPVFGDGDAWLAVDASRSSAPAGPVIQWTPGEDPRVVATNLTWLLQTWIRAMERGATHDPDALAALHRELNDGLPGPWRTLGAEDASTEAPH